jgi:hypothetical protein
MQTIFDHDKLQVYQAAIQFVGWADTILQKVPKGLAVSGQLDRASTSIPLNIARGSALESAACLDVLLAKKQITEPETVEGKTILARIVSMLVGLIKSTSPSRVYEEPGEYRTGND